MRNKAHGEGVGVLSVPRAMLRAMLEAGQPAGNSCQRADGRSVQLPLSGMWVCQQKVDHGCIELIILISGHHVVGASNFNSLG